MITLLAHAEVRLASSGGAARRDIEGGGVYVNETRISDINTVLTRATLAEGDVIVLRKGKKSYHVLKFG